MSMVMSHDPTVKSNFKNIINVVKRNGVTKVL